MNSPHEPYPLSGDLCLRVLNNGAIELYAPIADAPARRDPYAPWLVLDKGEWARLVAFLEPLLAGEGAWEASSSP